MRLYVWMAVGGAFGSLLRYLVDRTLAAAPGVFPWGTMTANIAGCFLLGWFTSRIIQRKAWPSMWKAVVGTGVIGAFTTFSTFSVETIQLIENGALLAAGIYVLVSAAGGLVTTGIGYRAGRRKN